MAITVINLTDPVSGLVTKTNIISGDLGDVALLNTGDSNTVDAINRLEARKATDSATVISLARSALEGGNAIVYDSDTGIISIDSSGVTSLFSYGTGIDLINTNEIVFKGSELTSWTSSEYDSASDYFLMLDGNSSVKAKLETINVKNSSGTVVARLLTTTIK